jgi:oligosaccharide repeat unit polymerase
MNIAKPILVGKKSFLIIYVHIFVCIFLVNYGILYQQLNPESEQLIYPLSCFLLVLTIWCFWSWFAITKSLFSPYILFFISALLFNGGQVILEIFNANENGMLNGVFTSDILLKTILIVDLGLAFFHLGALISASKAKVISKAPDSPTKKYLSNIKQSYQMGWNWLYISFLPSLLVLKESLTTVLSAGYFALYQKDIPTSFDSAPTVLASFLVPAALFILAGSKDNNKGKIVSGAVIVLYAMIYFLLGQRNVAVMPLLAFAWLWHQCISPIPKTILFSVGGFLVFIVFPLVGASRNSAGADRLSIEVLLETFSSINNPLVAAISEMGGSMNTIAYTIELVPKVREFQMGADYFYALLTLVPNLFWKVHPSVARGYPSLWLVWEIKPDIAAIGGGLGYSFIAEAYLNFGWFGAPIALGVMGFLFAKFILWAARSLDAARMATVASYTSFFLFFARAESANIVRSLVWYSLFPYLSVCLLGWWQSKKLAR